MVDRPFLRHTLATLSYRAGKALRGAPPGFGDLVVAPGARTPLQILAHMGDLFEWARAPTEARQTWHGSSPQPWDQEVARFFTALKGFDGHLASGAPLDWPAERLFQGPIADALTHTGQLTLLRRVAGSPVTGESYVKADIVVGVIGVAPATPRVELD